MDLKSLQVPRAIMTKVLPLFLVVFVWFLISPSWMNRGSIGNEFGDASREIVVSLERVPYRVALFARGEQYPACPGPECLLNPTVARDTLPIERVPFGSIKYVFNFESWRGRMFTRWDLVVPEFVGKKGDMIDFDFYGISGRSWRFFVNGELVAEGGTGIDLPAIRFPAPGAAGTPMVIGFEVRVGRKFAPGLVTVAQPFLSRPGIAKQLRTEYRALDALAKMPVATAYAFIATLAALACFFTPFYHEILAFAVYVVVSNWRMLLGQGMSGVSIPLDIDFASFDGILRCVAHSSLWLFYAFYFRVRSRTIWIPVAVFCGLAISAYAAGAWGVGVGLLKAMIDHASLFLVAVHGYGAYLAGSTAWKIWNLRGIRFRKMAVALMFVVCAGLCLAYAGKYATTQLSGDLFAASALNWIKILDTYALHLFVAAIGLVIAMEWSMIVRDRQALMEKFGRIVDPKFFDSVIRGPKNLSRRVENIVVLFVDLRGFTGLVEKYPPEEVTDSLNIYLDVVMRGVADHDGIVDKIVGDAVMAVWGVPDKGPCDPLSAVKAAIAIRSELREINEKRVPEGKFPLYYGIGIHSGSGIFTGIGNGRRVDFTVIGSVVNVASRLQNLTKEFNCDILVSRDVSDAVSPSIPTESVGDASIRGLSARIGVATIPGWKASSGSAGAEADKTHPEIAS